MTPSPCSHDTLLITPSSHAVHAGYTQPTPSKCLAATTASGRAPSDSQKAQSSWSFPAPLALPGDELAYDPSYPPQSFRSWKQEKDRNQITANRRTIYVAAPPTIKDADAVIRDWAHSPLLDAGVEGKLAQPKTEDVMEYISAFYHPIPVCPLPTPFRLTTWDEAPPKKSRSAPSSMKHVALAHGASATRIRVRSRSAKEIYTQQLNLDDVLDSAIAALPDDAYALLLLVHHDLYEGDDDDFCCGRAYGGSRVAVVTSARYHPGLDVAQELREARGHAWPASRCADYVKRLCEEGGEGESTKHKRGKSKAPPPNEDGAEPEPKNSPIRLAVSALLTPPSPAPTLTRNLELLYLSRFALTASHELGHTFGLDHCVYYSCIMNGIASLAEDARAAPYLCAVCSVKVGTVGLESEGRESGAKGKGVAKTDLGKEIAEAELERCRRLHAVCERWGAGDMFRAFGGWLSGRIVELEGRKKSANGH
ncbi:hypothetical protein HWV62_15048 [Athelia sp. TMB]|nr:hypothetical protein HWV62_15048 [Athelia sp. TMB]